MITGEERWREEISWVMKITGSPSDPVESPYSMDVCDVCVCDYVIIRRKRESS